MILRKECKIEEAVSTDKTRAGMLDPHIISGTIRASDGHILAVVPCKTEKSEEGPVSAEALKAARKHWKKSDTIEIKLNGSQEIPGGPSFPRPEASDFPRIAGLWPKRTADSVTIGIDAALLHSLADALGSDYLEIRISGKERAVVVRPVSKTSHHPEYLRGAGLIMPVRLPKK
jgi:hypothetical protein